MMNFRLIGVAALSLMLAGPAMAGSGGYGMHDVYHELYGRHRRPRKTRSDLATAMNIQPIIQGGEVCMETATTRAVLTTIWGLHRIDI